MSAPFTIEPATLQVGPISLTGFGLAVLLAFAIAHIIAQRELARRGHVMEAAAIPDVVTAALLGTLVGAKLYFVALTRDLYTQYLELKRKVGLEEIYTNDLLPARK